MSYEGLAHNWPSGKYFVIVLGDLNYSDHRIVVREETPWAALRRARSTHPKSWWLLVGIERVVIA